MFQKSFMDVTTVASHLFLFYKKYLWKNVKFLPYLKSILFQVSKKFLEHKTAASHTLYKNILRIYS